MILMTVHFFLESEESPPEEHLDRSIIVSIFIKHRIALVSRGGDTNNSSSRGIFTEARGGDSKFFVDDPREEISLKTIGCR